MPHKDIDLVLGKKINTSQKAQKLSDDRERQLLSEKAIREGREMAELC